MSKTDFINKYKAENLQWVAEYVESNTDSITSQDETLKGFKGEILELNGFGNGALVEDRVEAVFKGLLNERYLLHKVDPADPGLVVEGAVPELTKYWYAKTKPTTTNSNTVETHMRVSADVNVTHLQKALSGAPSTSTIKIENPEHVKLMQAVGFHWLEKQVGEGSGWCRVTPERLDCHQQT